MDTENLDANGIPIDPIVRAEPCPVCGVQALCDCVAYLGAVQITLNVFLGPEQGAQDAVVTVPIRDLTITLARLNKVARMCRLSHERNIAYHRQNKRDEGALVEATQALGKKLGIEQAVNSVYMMLKEHGHVSQPIVHAAPEPEYVAPKKKTRRTAPIDRS